MFFLFFFLYLSSIFYNTVHLSCSFSFVSSTLFHFVPLSHILPLPPLLLLEFLSIIGAFLLPIRHILFFPCCISPSSSSVSYIYPHSLTLLPYFPSYIIPRPSSLPISFLPSPSSFFSTSFLTQSFCSSPSSIYDLLVNLSFVCFRTPSPVLKRRRKRQGEGKKGGWVEWRRRTKGLSLAYCVNWLW